MPPNELAGLRGVLNEKAKADIGQSGILQLLAQMTPEQRQAYANLVAAPPIGTYPARPEPEEGLNLQGLLQELLQKLLARREPAPIPTPAPELEAPWMTGYESLPAPSPTFSPGPTPAPMQPENEVALLAEQLKKRREKMLPLQYIANPPPER